MQDDLPIDGVLDPSAASGNPTGNPQGQQRQQQQQQVDDDNDPSVAHLTGIFLNELTWYTSDMDLEEVVRQSGHYDELHPMEITFYENKTNGKSRGRAFLSFKSHQAALAVKKYLVTAYALFRFMTNLSLYGRSLTLKHVSW